MTMSYTAYVVRAASGNSSSQTERITECGQRLGQEWELPAMTAYLIKLGSGRFAVNTGAGAAAVHAAKMQLEHIMTSALQLMATKGGTGTLQLCLMPSSLSRSDWSVKTHNLNARNPSAMLIDCAEQLNDAGLNRLGPMIALAKTLAVIGNMRGGGQISANLEIATRGMSDRILRRDSPLLGTNQC